MVQIRQNEDEIKIIIELNRLITRKPDIVLLPTYLKFNTPPIFFERHLTQEIDETSSFCRIFKNEARIVLIKKQKGIWPEIFQKLSKDELLQRRLEISDQIVERNKERDQKVIERYELKRRNEIEKEIRRETAMRERVKQFEENACREALRVDGKETHARNEQPNGSVSNSNGTSSGGGSGGGGGGARVSSSATVSSVRTHQYSGRAATPAAAVRSAGRINVSFSNFNLATPKRESQEGRTMPFTVSNNCATEQKTPSEASPN